MKRRITLVIDVPDGRWVDHVKARWEPDELASGLTKVGVSEVPVLIGRLEDAPESWAYVLFTINDDLAERAKLPAVRDRLAKTLGTVSTPQEACKLAEAHGLLGVVDHVGCSGFGSKRADESPYFLNVKRTLAERLNWQLNPINSTSNYARTKGIPMPLPKLILKYLTAALEPPPAE